MRGKPLEDEGTLSRRVAEFEELDPEHPHLMLNVWMVLKMMDHRRITTEDLVRVTGKSKGYINQTIYGNISRFRNIKQYWSALEMVEDAITAITEVRGGVPAACCPVSGLDGYVEVLAETHTTYQEI